MFSIAIAAMLKVYLVAAVKRRKKSDPLEIHEIHGLRI